MSSRGLYGLVLTIMLALVMGANVSAQELCSSDFPDGIISAADIDTTLPADSPTGFVAGLLGTQEVFEGDIIGGLDWLYNNDLLNSPNFPTTEVGTQLVSWWTLADDRQTFVQVTNTNPQLTVEAHVVVLNESCEEVLNFCDTYTPNDTVIYDMSNLVRNNPTMGAVGVPGVAVPGGTQLSGEGTIIVTPTVDCNEAAPLNFPAIEYNYMQGTTTIIDEDVDFGANMFARYANGDSCNTNLLDVDPANGIIDATAGTTDVSNSFAGGLLDGTTEGCSFQNVLPTTLTKDYNTAGDGPTAADFVILQFADEYNALTVGTGYLPQPLNSSILGSIVDIDENPGSCGNQAGCFLRLGIDTVNQLSDNVDLDPGPGEELCDGADGDDDGLVDCADPDCDDAEICENGDVECSDGIDNDGDGDIDCADAGCVGFTGPDGVVCEAAEVSCDDGFDNDGDGLVDGDDPDCVTGDGDGDGDGGGSGCSIVASTPSSGSTTVNFLLPMMIFGLGIMVRRLRRK